MFKRRDWLHLKGADGGGRESDSDESGSDEGEQEGEEEDGTRETQQNETMPSLWYIGLHASVVVSSPAEEAFWRPGPTAPGQAPSEEMDNGEDEDEDDGGEDENEDEDDVDLTADDIIK